MIGGVRWPVAILVALTLSFLVLREAIVTAFASRAPDSAAVLWPSHPVVVLESGLAQVGESAAAGRPPDPALVKRLLAVSAVAPLAPEPFLVRGVQARVAGDEALAGRAFNEARSRNPRMVAARYFLADHYLRTGEVRKGLSEIAALARLVPGSPTAIAPYLAAYARAPSVAPQVKAMLRGNPALEVELLNALAASPSDSKLALSLWTGRSDAGSRSWQERMLGSLIAAERFDEARSAWNRFTGRDEAGQLDHQFRTGRLPPFGWVLASDSSGMVEPLAPGRIHVIYYGREDKLLASQLLMLTPGRYRLSMQVSDATPTAKPLAWSVRCLPSSATLIALPLAEGSRVAVLTGTIDVSGRDCAAQSLELKGTATDFAEQAEATISKLKLERIR